MQHVRLLQNDAETRIHEYEEEQALSGMDPPPILCWQGRYFTWFDYENDDELGEITTYLETEIVAVPGFVTKGGK